MTVKDQNLITILLAIYGTWHLVGRLAGYLIRSGNPLRPRVQTHLLPPPDYAVRRPGENLFRQEMYKRRMERQG